jgi:hypothetical protein
MRRASIVIASVLAASPIAAQPAPPAPPAPPPSQPAIQLKPDAQPHFEAGMKAYAAKDFETASRELGLAYDADPAPSLLFARAQALRQAGHCDQALPVYHQYLDTLPNDAQIAAMRPGMEICDKELAARVPPKPEPRPWYLDPIPDALVGGGAVSAGVGITYFVMASHSKTSSERATDRNSFVHYLDEANSRRTIGGVALGLGAALVAGGVVMFVLHHRGSDEHPLAAGTDGRSVFVAGTF